MSQPARTRPTSAELWAWQHEADDTPPVDIGGEEVTAVLVSHNGAIWLDQTLESIRNLDPRPTHIIGVDAGSADRTGEVMRRSGLFSRVIQTGADGFGAAVAEALHHYDPANAHPRSQQDPRGGRWFWFLHDDCILEPDALGALLRQGVSEPDIAILGPKILQHGREAGPPRLASVGETVAGSARLEYGVDHDEIDQHQHRAEDVLAVSSCGLLVRRGVFIDLQGFSPELPVFADGLDLGWRAIERGHRVRTCPESVIVHRQVGRNGQRESQVIGARPGATMRLMAMNAVAGHRHGPGALFGSIRMLVAGVLRALGFLLAKAPGRSLDELQAAGRFLGGGSARSLRSRTSRGDAATRERVRSLRPGPWSGPALIYEAIAAGITGRWRDTFASRDDPSLDELTGDEFTGTGHRRRRWISPVTVSFVIALLASIVAARGLIGPGRLAGPALLPSRDGLGAAFGAFTAPIAGAGDLIAPPWIGWVAIGSTITAGQPEAFVTIMLLGSVPLTFLTAQVWLGRTNAGPRVRALAGALYALVPALLGAVNRGALGVVVVAVLLPLVATAVHSLLTRPTEGPESWRPAWSTGLALTILLPFLPLALPFTLIALLTAGIIDGGARLRRVALAVVIPLVLLAPWWISLVASTPGRWFVGPDSALGSLDIVSAWQYWIGRTPGEGLPELWMSAIFFGLLWVAALAALVLAFRRAVVWVGWAVATLAGLIAVITSRFVVATLPVGEQVRPDVSTWLVVMAGALIAGGSVALDDVARSRRRGAGRVVLRCVTGLTAIVAVGGLSWAVVLGAAGPITREPATALPAFVVNSQTGPEQTRTLAIDLTGDQPQYQLLAGAGNRLGDADRGLAYEGSAEWSQHTRTIVAAMVSGSADESVGELLEQMAIGHVWVRGADDPERIRIGNTPGLGTASGEADWLVWTVPSTPGRAVVVQGDPANGGTVTPVALDGHSRGQLSLGDTDQDRRLYLSEPPDARWEVSVGGAPVVGQPDGQRQVFDLPPAVGELTIELVPPVPGWVRWVQLGLLVLVVVLAAPSLAGSRARREQARTSRLQTRGSRSVNTDVTTSPPPELTQAPAAPSADPDLTRPRSAAPPDPLPRPLPHAPDLTRPRRAAEPDEEFQTMILPTTAARRAMPAPPEQSDNAGQSVDPDTPDPDVTRARRQYPEGGQQ